MTGRTWVALFAGVFAVMLIDVPLLTFLTIVSMMVVVVYAYH